MKNRLSRLRKILADGKAQDIVEYALIAGFVAIAASATLPGMGRPLARIATKVARLLALAAGTSFSGCPSLSP